MEMMELGIYSLLNILIVILLFLETNMTIGYDDMFVQPKFLHRESLGIFHQNDFNELEPSHRARA